jgi:phosphatidylserine decarboxylase
LQGRRNPFISREGVPFVILAVALVGLAIRSLDPVYVAGAVTVLVVVFLVFRDPPRSIPASPLGVISPVDGTVVAVDQVDQGVLHGKAHRIRIRINSFGTYTARAPVEGKIGDLRADNGDNPVDYQTNALWIRTDEGEDVVLQFSGHRFGLAPRSFYQFGERVGQGQRFAYLRVTRFAELHLSITSQVLVSPGETVVAGIDLLGKLPHP